MSKNNSSSKVIESWWSSINRMSSGNKVISSLIRYNIASLGCLKLHQIDPHFSHWRNSILALKNITHYWPIFLDWMLRLKNYSAILISFTSFICWGKNLIIRSLEYKVRNLLDKWYFWGRIRKRRGFKYITKNSSSHGIA